MTRFDLWADYQQELESVKNNGIEFPVHVMFDGSSASAVDGYITSRDSDQITVAYDAGNHFQFMSFDPEKVVPAPHLKNMSTHFINYQITVDEEGAVLSKYNGVNDQMHSWSILPENMDKIDQSRWHLLGKRYGSKVYAIFVADAIYIQNHVPVEELF